MLKGKHLTIVLLAIIGLLCIIIGFLVLYPPQNMAAAPAASNLRESNLSDHSRGGTDITEGYTSPWTPTTDIELIESHFRQDEPGIRVLAGWVRNTGQETITNFQMHFNLSDPSETEYHEIVYSVGGIRFLPNQTRDFEAIITNHDTLTRIKNTTITVLR